MMGKYRPIRHLVNLWFLHMQILNSLPERDQQVVIRMLDAMAKAHEPATATG